MKWVLAFLMLGGVTIGFTQPVTRLWLKTTARAGTDVYDDLAVDTQRNVYVCGSSVNTTSTKYEIVVVKYDKNGVKLWEKFIAATSGHAVSRAITIDPNGHPIVAGQTEWNPPADGKSRVIKLAAASGAILYDTTGPAESSWYDIDVNSLGEGTATGYVGAGAAKKMRTTHFTATGTVAWTRDYAYPGLTATDQHGRYVIVNSVGDIYVCGVNNAFPTTIKNTILKFSRTGSILWSRHFNNAPGFDYPRGFGLGPNESPTMCMESRINNSTHSDGATIVRYDANGAQINKRMSGGIYEAYSVTAFAVDMDGNYFLAGSQTFLGEARPFYQNLDAKGGSFTYGLQANKEVRAIAAAPSRGEYFVGLNLMGSGARPTTIQAMNVSRDYSTFYYPTYSWTQMLFGSSAQTTNPYFLISRMVMDSMGDLYAIANGSGAQGQDAFIVKYELAGLARPDEFMSQTGTIFNAAGEGVSANDNQITQSVTSVVAQPANGTVNLQSDGTFSYMPDSGFAGIDTFTYRHTRTNSSVPRTSDSTARMMVMPNLTGLIIDPPSIYGGGHAAIVVSVSPVPNQDIPLVISVSQNTAISSYPGITVRGGNGIAGGVIGTRQVTAQEVVTFTVKSGTSTRTATLTVKAF